MTPRACLTWLILVGSSAALVAMSPGGGTAAPGLGRPQTPAAAASTPSTADRPSPDEAPRLDDDSNLFEADSMLPGICFAGSRIRDTDALGGFAGSRNLPRPVETDQARAAPRCYLLAQPRVAVRLGDGTGMRLVLVNPTKETISLVATDSRLAIVQEALDASGAWKPVEYLPRSFCGNSYHRVFLGPREYWSFPARRYTGAFETKLRFRLSLGEGQDLLSNEFDGSINPEQLVAPPPHRPRNLMDPSSP